MNTTWIYLSPHLDDVVLSCGGLVWEQVQAGATVQIWTICAGDPHGPLSAFAQSLHARWQTGPETVGQRRAEDEAACARLGAGFRHFSIPDCIYRNHPNTGAALYASEEAIFGPVDEAETGLIRDLAEMLRKQISAGARLVSPMTLGRHVDHCLVRAAAEAAGLPLWVYADYPYAVRHPEQLAHLIQPAWAPKLHEISEAGIQAWALAIACHTSQISTFWHSLDEMERAIREYYLGAGGIPLWEAGLP